MLYRLVPLLSQQVLHPVPQTGLSVHRDTEGVILSALFYKRGEDSAKDDGSVFAFGTSSPNLNYASR